MLTVISTSTFITIAILANSFWKDCYFCNRFNSKRLCIIDVTVIKQIAKCNAERQKLYRSNLSKDKLKFEKMKQKSRIRDNTRQKKLKSDELQ